MRYVVNPGQGVGAVRFGMSREEVHARLGAPEEEGVWEDSDEVEDDWEEDGIAVRFDPSGVCVEISLFPPATATIGGVRVLGEHDEDGAEALRRADADCVTDDDVIVSAALGLLFTSDEEGVPELVLLAPGRLDALAVQPVLADDDDDDDDDDSASEADEDMTETESEPTAT